jgi:hypothetical protein
MVKCLVVGDHFVLVGVPKGFCRKVATKLDKGNQEEAEMMIDRWINKQVSYPMDFFLNSSDWAFSSDSFLFDTFLEAVFPEAGVILFDKQ